MILKARQFPSSGLIGAMRSIFRFSMVRTLGSLLGFAATFLATAALGPEDAGVLFGSFAWAAGLAIIARWGLSDRLLLEIPPLIGSWRQNAIPAIVNLDLVASMRRLALVLAAVTLLWLAASAMQFDVSLSFWFIAAYLPSAVLLQILAAAAKGVGRLGWALTFEFAAPPMAVLITAGLIRMELVDGSLALMGAAYVLGTLLGALGCYLMALRHQWHGRILHKAKGATRIRNRDFALIEISNFLNSWLAMLMLPFLLSAADVGIFNIAFRLTAAIGLVSTTIYIIVMPRLAVALANRDRESWRSTILQARIVMVLLGIGFAAAIYLLGPMILAWAGTEFLAAERALFIMAGCFSLAVALGPSGGVLSAAKEEGSIRNANIAVTILSLFLLVPAVQYFGLEGAACVTGLAFLSLKVLLVIMEFALQRRMTWPDELEGRT